MSGIRLSPSVIGLRAENTLRSPLPFIQRVIVTSSPPPGIRTRKPARTSSAVVADFYKKDEKFRAVNGVGTIDEIFGRLCDAIDALK